MNQLCDAAESACKDLTKHMQREELQVQPAFHSLEHPQIEALKDTAQTTRGLQAQMPIP